MTNEKLEQDIRARFYTSQSVARYIRANGVPKSRHAFRDMVASGASEKLDSEKRPGADSLFGSGSLRKAPPANQYHGQVKR